MSALRFNDAALDNLGRKEINSRLVSEIIAHPAFEKLITDIEIYVDGYVQQAMDQLNTMREYRRRKLIKGRTLSAQYNFKLTEHVQAIQRVARMPLFEYLFLYVIISI